MKYDFTTIIDRKGKDAMALDAVGSQKVMSRNLLYLKKVLVLFQCGWLI